MFDIELTLNFLKNKKDNFDVAIEMLTEHNIDEYKKKYNTVDNKCLFLENKHLYIWNKDSNKEYVFIENYSFIYSKIIRYFELKMSNKLDQHNQLIDNKERLLTSLNKSFYINIKKMLDRVIVFDINLYRTNQRIEDVKSQYKKWEKQFDDECFYIEFYTKKYPVVTKNILNLIEEYMVLIENIFKKIEKDYRNLSNEFKIEHLVTDISLDLGDKHIFGEQVLAVEFYNKKLIYKPRSGNINELVARILDYIKKYNNKVKLCIPKFINKQDYHWSEFIEESILDSDLEKQQYHYNMGGLLALMYCTNSHDIHSSNLIIRGNNLYLIDLECLFTKMEGDIDNKQHALLKDSVLSTHVIPILQGQKEDKYYSGLHLTNENKVKIGKIINAEQSDARFENIEVFLANIKINLADKKYFYLLETGFFKIYQLIMSNKQEFLTIVTSYTKKITLRFLVRGTNDYASIIDAGYHPRFLTNFVDRELFFSIIYKEKLNKNLQKFEYTELISDRIPLFEVDMISKNLYMQNKKIANFFKEDVVTQLEKKLKKLNEIDLIFQKALIKKSLNVFTNKYIDIANRNENNLEFSSEDINYILRNMSILETGYFINTIKIDNSDMINIMDNYLYNGKSGIIFIFIMMYAYTNEEEWVEKAEKLYIGMLNKELEANNIGFFTGYGSYLYISYLLFKYTRKEEYLRDFFMYCTSIEGEIRNQKKYDFLSGSAGILTLLLNIYKEYPNEKIIKIIQSSVTNICEGVLYTSEQYITWENGWMGFSHGNAGIIHALCLYNSLFPSEYIKKIIYKALLYERTGRYENGWYDLRSNKKSEDFYAWCHGLPGIIQSRRKILSMDNISTNITKIINEDIYIAEKNYFKCFNVNSYSLCHGLSGNALCLEYQDNTILLLNKHCLTIKSILENKIDINIDFSLMTGILGEIYSIIKFDKKTLPNILLAEV